MKDKFVDLEIVYSDDKGLGGWLGFGLSVQSLTCSVEQRFLSQFKHFSQQIGDNFSHHSIFLNARLSDVVSPGSIL